MLFDERETRAFQMIIDEYSRHPEITISMKDFFDGVLDPKCRVVLPHKALEWPLIRGSSVGITHGKSTALQFRPGEFVFGGCTMTRIIFLAIRN
jgi:hypothetical protein